MAAPARIRLRPGKHALLRTGRPWVYRGEVERVEGAPASGDVVVVEDARGGFVAWAFYHERSLLAARLLSTDPDERIDDAFIQRRLAAAIAYRGRVLGPEAFAEGGACRLVFAEADGLPGLVVDRFDRILVLQVLTVGMERRLDLVCSHLADLTGLADVFERNDAPVRRLEGLPERVGTLRGHPPDAVQVREGGIRLNVDLRLGQKTGHFVDQRENRARFGEYVRRLLVDSGPGAAPRPSPEVRVLDAFCHTGGFGLHALAAGATHALFVDAQAPAVEAVGRHAELNGLSGWEATRANAFDLLREFEREGRRFEAVVLDPPAFARGRAHLDSAYRGYKEINLRAMRLLSPGGLLCTCSCSQAVGEAMFEEMLQDAAADARRRMRIVERRGAPPDHPGLLGADETRYLKCFFLQAVD